MTQREKDEFLEAYNQIHESLMRFCIVKSRGIMDPKDLANDTLLVGLENYSKLKEKKALLSYLFTTANRICLNKIRRQKFEGYYDEKAVNRLEDSQSDSATKVDIHFLYDALDQLPALQKEAIILFEISDLPLKEIMVIQNSGESAVKQRIKRGREKLAELLREKERKKIALLAATFFTSQAFGMTNLNLYFQAVKDLPLPLSQAQAASTITGYSAMGSAINASATKLSTVVLKKIGLGVVVGAIGVATILGFTQSNKPEDSTKAVISSLDEIGDSEESNDNFSNRVEKLLGNNPSGEEKTIKEQEMVSQGLNNNPIFDEFNDENLKFSAEESETSALLTAPKQPGIKLEGNTFSMENIEQIRIDNLGDNIEVKTWNRNEVQVIAHYIVEAKTPEDEAFIRSRLAFSAEKNGAILVLKSAFCDVSRSSIGFGKNKLNTIDFGNGKKIKYKTIESNYTVMVPASANLNLIGHYKTFAIPDMAGNLTADFYETQFTSGSIAGEGKVKLHYSKATMGNFSELDLTVFEGTATFKNAEMFTLNGKYATVTAENVQGSEINLFESKFTANLYRGALKADIKYSSLHFLKSELAASSIEAFESKIEIPTFKNLEVDLRYSSLTSETIGSLSIPVAFESKFYLGTVASINATSSKYSSYSISNLAGKITMSSFEDKLTILKSTIAPMLFEGKYSTYQISLCQPYDYRFKLDGNYCKLDYGSHELKINREELVNSHKILEGFFHGADANSALISFDCFESTISLQ